ncbi:histidine kinase [Sphingomonas gei]|uniref:histidine kinase n=1 Tax=Sphingomonas gei TaxID=1395960 RepID=A0A4S1X382_9SPHN|nr:sensor histidine kinase [Sphingomonas gei]TGX50401.1 histidine kinase [Sphingomonas gei]
MPQTEQTQSRFTRRVMALVAIGFLALIAAGVATAWLQARSQQMGNWVEHTLGVQARLADFASANERVETARRGVLLGGGTDFRKRMDLAAGEARAALDDIARVTADNPRQARRARALRDLLVRQRELQLRSISTTDARRSAAQGAFEDDPAVIVTRQVRDLSRSMIAEERKLLAVRQVEQANALATFYAILALTGVLLVIVAAITLTVMLRYTRDLTASRIELRRLNQGLEAMVDARTAELQRANQEIQRFAYIVSHDLRSPLVNVMGFTAELDAARKTVSAHLDAVEASSPELVAEAVRLAVREDLPEAIGFIRTSTQKMDRLINAILRLSREGRRNLMVESVDLDALVQSIVDSLQHRVSDVGAEILAEALPALTSDRLAVEQILSNLIENALKYLNPGRPGVITVRGHNEGDRVVLEVADNGRGVDPRDHERIFDLFRRSGAQDQPGEGIGLAHVRALAYRLGGLIEIRSELDRGATFRLSLPRVLKPGGE